MLINKVKIIFRATEYNGYPSVRVFLDHQLLQNITFTQEYFEFEFDLDQTESIRCLCVERYGKTDQNYSLEKDQIVEIVSINVDGIPIPQFMINAQCKFEFAGETHIGSCYFGPNGVWTFDFETPLITYILDKKIQHEAQYNQDYLYPWSYKLGPDSVTTILANIDQALDRADKL